MKFCFRFNRPLHLPESLLELHLSKSFSRPISLPNSLHTVRFGEGFRGSVRGGAGLQRIEWFCHHPCMCLPPTVRQLLFGEKFQLQVCLPGLETLVFCRNYSLPLVLPSTLKTIQFRQGYMFPLALPPGCTQIDP